MPSRMIDFDALWTSGKLDSCRECFRVEYAWLYGLADPFGCFELNIKAIHSRVSAIRPKLSSKRLEKILAEFEQKGLLFVWISNGRRYGFWTNSDRPGRLPKLSERHRYKRFAPEVPKQELAEYESRFCRDFVATPSRTGVGFGLGVGIGVGAGVGQGEGGGLEGETQKPPSRKTETHKTQRCPHCVGYGKLMRNGELVDCDYCVTSA